MKRWLIENLDLIIIGIAIAVPLVPVLIIFGALAFFTV